MIVMRKIYYLLCVVILLASCQQQDMPDLVAKMVTVEMTLDTGVQVDVNTRAATPLIPDVENLIYDIWVIQYDHEGILTQNPGAKHYRTSETGLLSVIQDLTLAVGQSTVCLLVNMGYGTDTEPVEFPDNLPAFKNLLAKVPVEAAADGTLERMPMCGYWQGIVGEDTKQLSVTLGRMMTRINLVLNNASSTVLNGVKASLINVPQVAHVFPTINSNVLPNGVNGYTKVENDDVGNIAVGASVNRYFYIAPNLWNTQTLLRLTAADKETLEIPLGNDAPDVLGGSTKLYPNNIYTFTINLK